MSATSVMVKKLPQYHKDLIHRYLLWAYKTTKEGFERIERKSTQLIVDEYILKQIKITMGTPSNFIGEFEAYIKTKQADERKLKSNPQYVYLKNRLKAIEAAIKYFLGTKALNAIHSLYEKEFISRILQAREH